MHHHGTFDERSLGPDPALAGHAEGYGTAPLVDASVSLHQRVSVSQLAPGGSVDPHLHSYEEGVYVLSGRVTVTLAGAEHELGPDDFAFAQAGTPHAWRNAGGEAARWLEISAPQPKAAGGVFPDTFFAVSSEAPENASSRFGHFDESQLPPLALAGFTAANVSGASLRMLVDPPFGAAHFNLFTVQYTPGGLIKEHDHPFEEAYYIVDGEIEALADGTTYTLRAGDYFWTGVGCPHAFTNRSDATVRWVETQVPQPPSREAARFKADWPSS
jgi:quercetin dioxygenase-like cupin family protein